MGAAKGSKGKAKRPLGPRKMLALQANRAAARIARHQRTQPKDKHSSPSPEFDDGRDWADVGKQVMPSREVLRRFL